MGAAFLHFASCGLLSVIVVVNHTKYFRAFPPGLPPIWGELPVRGGSKGLHVSSPATIHQPTLDQFGYGLRDLNIVIARRRRGIVIAYGVAGDASTTTNA